jgi:hypothetical protein
MLVAILVICYVLVLRYLDQKNREKDRIKSGVAIHSGPADYGTIKKALAETSERLAVVEGQYRELARRLGVTQ